MTTCPWNERALAAIVEWVVEIRKIGWTLRCGIICSGGIAGLAGVVELAIEDGGRREGKGLRPFAESGC